MSKAIVVDGCTLQIQSPGNSGITPAIQSTPSTNVKAGGKGVFFKEIKFQITGYMSLVDPTWIAQTSPANGSITATGKWTSDGTDKVVLEGDVSGTVTINGTHQVGNHPEATTEDVTVKVISAGQSYVKEL